MNPVRVPTQDQGARVVQPPVQLTPRAGKGICHTGILQIYAGTAAVIFNLICTYTTTTVPALVGPGYWGGLMFLIAGMFGVVAYKKKIYGYVITYMVLSLISAPLTLGLLVTAPIGIAQSTVKCESNFIPCYPGINLDDCGSQYRCSVNNTGVALNSLLLICGVVELVAAITASAFCCAAICCNTTADNTHSNRMTTGLLPPTVVYAQSSQYALHGIPVIITGHAAPGQPMVAYPMSFQAQSAAYPATTSGCEYAGVNRQTLSNQLNVNDNDFLHEMSPRNATSPAMTGMGDQQPPAYSYY